MFAFFTPYIHILLLFQLTASSSLPSRPNIIFILTDDQDLTIAGMQGMHNTQRLIIDQGLTFKNSFVSSPVCCVSRSSIMSGRYVHNHHVRNNSYDGGCSNQTWQTEVEPECVAVHLHELGYTTFYSGKYLNQYGIAMAGGPQHIPPGFDHWYGLIGNSRYYNYSISNNGVLEEHGDDYAKDYYTDLIKNQSLAFLTSYDFYDPVFMTLATPAAHGPFTPAPQYADYDKGLLAPRLPNWNNVAVNAYKHELFRKYITTPMDTQEINGSDTVFQHRRATLRSVDDMIDEIYQVLLEKKQINNTYFLYFSDNGFQDGQFGQGGDKRQLYENDIRVPMCIKGPGITAQSVTERFALNIDIAPTLIELAGGSVPQYMDGMSLVPFLLGAKENKRQQHMDPIRQQFLVEYYGEVSNITTGLYGPDAAHPLDSWNNTYDCVRVIDYGKQQMNGTIYCKFKCYDRRSHIEVECEDKTVPQFYGEAYDLDADFYQLRNTILQLNATEDQTYLDAMKQLLACKGQTCNELRNSGVAPMKN